MSEIINNTKVFLTTFAAVTGLMHQVEAAHLTPQEIARAWQDPVFRQSLTEAQQASLPANPAGDLQFTPRSGNTLRFVNVVASTQNDYCSTNNCSSNNCSSSNCSSSNCSSDNCSSSNCSSNNCSTKNCFGIG